MPETKTAPDATASDTTNVVIKCAGLSKVFKDFWMRSRVRAVDDIDLEVRRGEVFGLLGPNGSGKSTTIKMVLGLLHPTAGRIAVFGRLPHDVAIKQRIGYLPEESYLYRFLNARETLEYYGQLFGQNRRRRQNRIDMLLEMVGLDRVSRRPIGEYSKGMQRRIGLAQALINDPELLILDEPTTGLDPIGTRQIKDLIVKLSRRGKTILLCSHLLADVEDVCDRVAIMFGGRIRKSGTVDQLLVNTGQTTIQTGSLSAPVIDQIEKVLEPHGRHIERVDQPRQKLEALFLDIVHEAQAEGAANPGAQAGGKIADFLIGESAAAAAIIDDLVSDDSGAAASGGLEDELPLADEPPGADAQMIGQLVNDPAGAAASDPTGDGPVETSTEARFEDGSGDLTSGEDRSDGESHSDKAAAPAPVNEQVDRGILDALTGADPATGSDEPDAKT